MKQNVFLLIYTILLSFF